MGEEEKFIEITVTEQEWEQLPNAIKWICIHTGKYGWCLLNCLGFEHLFFKINGRRRSMIRLMTDAASTWVRLKLLRIWFWIKGVKINKEDQ